MCGRAKLEGDVSEIKIAFRVPPEYPTPNFPPSWNVAPTDSLPIVRYDQKAGHRALDLMRWGLVPYWAKDTKIGFSTINGWPRQWTRSRYSAKRLSDAAASCLSRRSMNGRKSARRRSSLTPSRSLTAA